MHNYFTGFGSPPISDVSLKANVGPWKKCLTHLPEIQGLDYQEAMQSQLVNFERHK